MILNNKKSYLSNSNSISSMGKKAVMHVDKSKFIGQRGSTE